MVNEFECKLALSNTKHIFLLSAQVPILLFHNSVIELLFNFLFTSVLM